MANPTIETIPYQTITKVATNITAATIVRLNDKPSYRQTYRQNGEAAPTDLSDFAPCFINTDYIAVNSDTAIDVYMYVNYNDEDGKVRVDA
jgi:hypothetical protein